MGRIVEFTFLAGGSEDYLLTLANSLLSLESPTRGKFILLSSLSRHLSTHKFLKASPQLPSELMSVMGHQALACHVSACIGYRYCHRKLYIVSYLTTYILHLKHDRLVTFGPAWSDSIGRS